MKLRVIREPSKNSATLGALYVDGVWQCWTLEDVLREPVQVPAAADRDAWVRSWKVDGETAIPAGTYRIVMSMSNRFKRILPHVQDVPGFLGVRIHSGNKSKDTEGCLLVGQQRGDAAVLQSVAAMDALFARLTAGSDRQGMWITYENPR